MWEGLETSPKGESRKEMALAGRYGKNHPVKVAGSLGCPFGGSGLLKYPLTNKNPNKNTVIRRPLLRGPPGCEGFNFILRLCVSVSCLLHPMYPCILASSYPSTPVCLYVYAVCCILYPVSCLLWQSVGLRIRAPKPPGLPSTITLHQASSRNPACPWKSTRSHL